MPKHSLYTIKAVLNKPQHYTCTKFDSDFNVLEVYQMQESGQSIHCFCPAHKSWCRHCEMLRLFQAEDRVDKGWMYNFDKKQWLEPPTVEM